MMLTEARAHCADLIDLPVDPASDGRSLEALARWLVRFSPSVAIDPPATIFLDATGLERLFGGVANVHARVAAALRRLQISAGVAIAPTPGAAWAIAAFGGAHALAIVEAGEVDAALAPLPPEALRLDLRTASALRALGIASVTALRRLPRASLGARFGPALLQRIDQALGAVPEPLVYLEHRTPVRAIVEFEGVVESLEALHMALAELVRRVAAQLARQGLGARRLQVSIGQPYLPPLEKTIELTRPSRSGGDLLNLLRCTLETVKVNDGFLSVGLAAPTTERLHGEQEALIGGEHERVARESDRLIERLDARMAQDVERVSLVASHAPERAFAGHGHIAANPKARADAGPAHPAAPARPLRLFASPREVRVTVTPSTRRDGWPVAFTDDAGHVHRLSHVRGPERIAGQWWRGRWKTRDYFDAIDEAGGRYWLFRVAESGRWFLHGVFE